MVDKSKAQQDLLHEISAAYNNRMRPRRATTDKQECDLYRKTFSEVMHKVKDTINEVNNEIQEQTDPDKLFQIMRTGYIDVLSTVCDTLDYDNNI